MPMGTVETASRTRDARVVSALSFPAWTAGGLVSFASLSTTQAIRRCRSPSYDGERRERQYRGNNFWPMEARSGPSPAGRRIISQRDNVVL